MDGVFLFACLAALNPTLLAVTTVILLLENPKRLLVGYLCGALMTSITLGLVIVFSLEGSSFEDTAQNTLSPAANFALGGILLVIAYVLATGRDKAMSERRHERKAEKGKAEKEPSGPPKWQQFLDRGSAGSAFIVGALLTLPGASYLTALSKLAAQDLSTAGTVITVLVINVIMLALLELPTLSYQLAPDTTAAKVDRVKAAVSRHGRQAGIWGAAVVGGLLIVRGVIELVS
jgi:hypothetical protein